MSNATLSEIKKYQAYSEYKPTHLGWLNEIPAHWEVKRLKYLGEAIIGLTYSPADVVDNESIGTLVLRSSNVQNKQLAFHDNVYVSKKIPSKLSTQKGDILICARNGSRALIGKNAQIDEQAAGMTFGAFMSIFRSPFNDYLSKVFNSALFEYQSGSFLTATINQLTTANLNSFEIPLPPKYEREKIADFLDHETAKIDTLIDKQQQLIQLLKEKRQAVISHAVTKGLNPNATMKDSGVEWLGEVPEHWDVLQIRRILDSMEQGKSPECDSHVSEAHEWGVLKTSCVNKAIYNSEANKALPSTTAPFVQYEVKKGDVLMSRASGSINLIGSVAYVDETRSQILLSDKIFRLHLNQKVNRKFFTLLMRSTYMRRNIERSISGAEGMANNITKSAIIGFSFALPPKEDQDRISSIAMQQLDVFDELIVKVETAIGLIQERRTALISAAVTGKIDVREWNASKMETNA